MRPGLRGRRLFAGTRPTGRAASPRQGAGNLSSSLGLVDPAVVAYVAVTVRPAKQRRNARELRSLTKITRTVVTP